MAVNRFDVFLVNLDPIIGSEIRKTRPCLIISPNEMNRNIRTVIIAPMTTKVRRYPTRVACKFQRKEGQIIIDQICTIDKSRLVQKLGKLDRETRVKVLNTLPEMFGE